MVFLSTDNCLMAHCYQCFRNSLDIARVAVPGNVGWRQKEMEGSNEERKSDECPEANEHNAVVDEVNYTNGYASMATSEKHFDDAMLMDYKVMVVLLFASLADR